MFGQFNDFWTEIVKTPWVDLAHDLKLLTVYMQMMILTMFL